MPAIAHSNFLSCLALCALFRIAGGASEGTCDEKWKDGDQCGGECQELPLEIADCTRTPKDCQVQCEQLCAEATVTFGSGCCGGRMNDATPFCKLCDGGQGVRGTKIRHKTKMCEAPAKKAAAVAPQPKLSERFKVEKTDPLNWLQNRVPLQERLPEGFMMGMSSQRVIGISTKHVVMCFSREDGSGCAAANLEVQESSEKASKEAAGQQPVDWDGILSADIPENVSDTILWPAITWGPVQPFPSSAAGRVAGRVELERLSPKHFVVCYESGSEKQVLCALGVVQDGDVAMLRPFSEEIQLGYGSLVSLTPSGAGKTIRFATCQEANGVNSLECRWTNIVVGDAGPEALRLAEDEPAIVADTAWRMLNETMTV